MFLNNFEYFAPQTVDEVLKLMDRFKSKAQVLAGGTDLINEMKEKILSPEYLIDITGVEELAGIHYEPGKGLYIGAATKIAEIEHSEIIREKYFALHQAAGELGSVQVRNMATLGGNSCHASPAAETPPPLIALGARVTTKSVAGEREMPLEEFILGNRKNALQEGEILYRFFLPEPPERSASRYMCLGLRDAMEIDVVNVAVNLVLDDDRRTCKDVRIVMGSVAPTPLRAVLAEQLLIGQVVDPEVAEKAGQTAAAEAKPISDIRASAEYRREVIGILVRRVLMEAYAAAAGKTG